MEAAVSGEGVGFWRERGKFWVDDLGEGFQRVGDFHVCKRGGGGLNALSIFKWQSDISCL